VPPGFGPAVAAMPVVQFGPTPGAIAPPPPAAPAGPIEAGCGYEGASLRGDIGSVFQIACPTGCQDTGGVRGTEIYTAYSAICRAGIHAGAIAPGGGVVTVRIEPGRPAYRGSMRYGIQSSDGASDTKRFRVLVPPGQAAASAQPGPTPAGFASPPPARPDGPIEAGCSYEGASLQGDIGSIFQVACPPGCQDIGAVRGTEIYTLYSTICRSGIHAGRISPDGGVVTVRIESGRPAYRGSLRHGIQSSDWAKDTKSFRALVP